MKRKEYLALLKANKDAIIDKLMEVHKADLRYQVDLYIYPDGELNTFSNPGGNSWLDDDHEIITYINHEYGWEECRDEDGNFCADEDALYDLCYAAYVQEVDSVESLIRQAEKYPELDY